MGLYVIALSLRAVRHIRVGALGRLKFDPGLYLYSGSALRGMEHRLARHKRRDKKTRWHIDYLRRKAEWEWAVTFPSALGECALARLTAESSGGRALHHRFGASDCHCPGHLVYAQIPPEQARQALLAMGGLPFAPPQPRRAKRPSADGAHRRC